MIDCTGLWLGYYVCIHVPGAATTIQSPAITTTTTPSEGYVIYLGLPFTQHSS